jgi:type II secretory pathway pseudopilin PulG
MGQNSIPHPASHGGLPVSSERGLTLLEVTLTVVLMTVLALSVGLLVVPTARQTRINREAMAANGVARSAIEAVHSTAFPDVLEKYPQGSTESVPALPGGQLQFSYEDPAADPLRVRIDLTWSSLDLGTVQRSFFTAKTE